MTPRMFQSQLNVHKELKEMMSGAGGDSPQEAFVDQIAGW